jgi:hypothetical protein
MALTEPQKDKGTGTMAGPPHSLDLSAFGNNRRGSFALADSVGLCRGRDAKERQRRCRQYSECFHGTLLCFVMTNAKVTGGMTPPLVLKRHTERFN